MADFLDKLKQGLDKGITTVGVKSKEVIETRKVKGQITNLEFKKKMALEELGKTTYIRYRFEKDQGIEKPSFMKTQRLELQEWEFALFEVLNNLSEGKLKIDLYEETDKDFKITGHILLKKVKEILPKFDKAQPLQWLGKVLTKFDLPTSKTKKRTKDKVETIYKFNKKRVPFIIEKTTNQQYYDEQNINKRCEEIFDLDNQIKEKEEQIENIRMSAQKKLDKQP